MVCDAEDCGFQTLNNDEIVASVHRDSDPVDDETDEDEDNNSIERSKGPSNADAFSTLETAMEWYEQQSKFCSSQLLLLKRMRDLGAKKRRLNRFLASKNISVAPQPPYSPDLSPCDFFLVPKSKNHLEGHHFGTLENIQMAATDQLKAIPISEFHQCDRCNKR
ncbi:uncharacterized protein TNCV_3105451 [Trichonephila clavipes]|nr:uncharacterized protein TNCV_3105451 [Trichonephila clavipes]